MTDAISPFQIVIPEMQLEDLRERLARTRWPEAETVDDWSQGVPLTYVKELCDHWSKRYDWRATESRINSIPQFTTEIDGLLIHFLHVRSPTPNAFPLLITHGWPGSIVEFLKVIGPLSDPLAHGGEAADAFDVICPALPGYGFSAKPATTGWGVDHIADAWAQLMARLGYDHYGAQGGDWGAVITTALARNHADHLTAIHLNMPIGLIASLDPDPKTDQERSNLAARKVFQQWETGYSKEQATRPQTLGYGLTDSPAAQCAWIVEKFRAWTDCDGHPENAFTRDELLDNVMFYWLTSSGTSSARLYWENNGRNFGGDGLVNVPTGFSIFPKEIAKTSRRMAEGVYSDIRYWNELDRGGHFAAFEQPELFVDELRSFFRLVR